MSPLGFEVSPCPTTSVVKMAVLTACIMSIESVTYTTPHYLLYFIELFTWKSKQMSVNQIEVHFRGDSGASHTQMVGRSQG